jgi:hypothetical protein
VIELPKSPAPNFARPTMLDFGYTLRPVLGGPDQRVNRAGSRFAIEVGFAPMEPRLSRTFVSRLLQAQSEGLRISFPLPEAQGAPGSPVVDGAGQAGTTLALRNLTPNYVYREGWWLSVESAAGQHYLHNIRAAGKADAGGEASLQIWPELRAPFADGDAVHLGKPMIEGLPLGDERSWEFPVGKLISLQFAIREVE